MMNTPVNLFDMEQNFASNDEYEEWVAETENQKTGTENEIDGIDCPICRNKGQVFRWDRETHTRYVNDCQCLRMRRSIRQLDRSSVCRDWRKKTFHSFEAVEEWQRVLKRRVRMYAEHPNGHWMLITGQSGCGKTHLATAAYIELVQREQFTGEYVRWADMVNQANSAQFDAAETEKLDRKWIGCDLLYIDDLFKKRGKAEISDREFDITLSLIDARYKDPQKLTILSTERTFSDLLEMDEALAGRLRERCQKNIVQVKLDAGRNYRLRGITEI